MEVSRKSLTAARLRAVSKEWKRFVDAYWKPKQFEQHVVDNWMSLRIVPRPFIEDAYQIHESSSIHSDHYFIFFKRSNLRGRPSGPDAMGFNC